MVYKKKELNDNYGINRGEISPISKFHLGTKVRRMFIFPLVLVFPPFYLEYGLMPV